MSSPQYEGKACHKCGKVLRWKSNRTCVACNGKHALRYYHLNRAKIAEKRNRPKMSNTQTKELK